MATDPREPLSPEEAALARVYATLPGGDPPAALDARVLAQARAAVAAPPRRTRPWLLMPGVGAAAAAVLAAGMAWQLGWLGGAPLPDVTQGPSSGVAVPTTRPKKQEEEKQRVDIDYVRQEAIRESSDAAASADAEVSAPALRKPATPPAPPAPPPPPAPRAQSEPGQFVPEPPPVVLDDATPMSSPAPQPAAPAESAAAASNAQSVAGAAGRAATAERSERTRATDLPPWPQDAQLEPEAWLDRVRERVRLGDRQGAEFSLRRFVQAHPTRAVPAELQRLLVE